MGGCKNPRVIVIELGSIFVLPPLILLIFGDCTVSCKLAHQMPPLPLIVLPLSFLRLFAP